MKIAVSIRYLQVTGTSHAQIYLYSGDGKLIRRLSETNEGQDVDPVFSPDGREIAFTRKLKNADQVRVVQTLSGKVQEGETQPLWYQPKNELTPRFTSLSMEWENWYKGLPTSESSATPEPSPTSTPRLTRLVAPDNSMELILDRSGDDQKDYDNQELGKLYRFRDLKTGEESLLGNWEGFETIWGPLHLRGSEESYFLIELPLRTVFFFTHLNSTDGNTVHALDLARKRVVRLSPNNATPIPMSNFPGFFTITEERYVPLGDGKRTVNCSYFDRWDAAFKKVRYARSAPAIFGGAAVFRSDQAPLVVPRDTD